MQQPEQNNTMRHSANPGIGEPPLFQIVGQRAETRISPNRAPSELLSVCSENRRKKLESAAREQERRYGKAHARAHPRSGL
jgi:hypothetical protein